MAVYRAKGRKFWITNYSYNGRSIRISTPYLAQPAFKQSAQDFEDLHKSQKYAEENKRRKAETSGPSVRTAFAYYHRNKPNLSQKRNSVDRREYEILALADARLDLDTKIDKIDDVMMLTVLQEMQNRNLKPNTIRNCFGTLAAAIRFYCKMYRLAAVNLSWMDLRPASPAPRDRSLTVDEWEALKANMPEYLHDIVVFTLYTGLRKQNILTLRWGQINFKTSPATYTVVQKGDKQITRPLSDAAIAHLKEIRKKTSSIGDVPVFKYVGEPVVNAQSKCSKETAIAQWRHKHYGKPVKNIDSAFRKACIRAGIEGFRFHDLRHTYGHWSIEAGIPMHEISYNMGHFDSAFTAKTYAQYKPHHVQEGINRLGERIAMNI